ncbi:MAG: amidophosphoribosyltransferase [bacterium]
MKDSIKDNCGVIGIVSSNNNILDDLYLGAFYLQHRGQQYCGISTYDGKDIKIRTHRGLLRETFEKDLHNMEGTSGIAHLSLKDRQPIKLTSRIGEFTLCFSGNINNADELIKKLQEQGHTFYTTSDSELIGKLIGMGADFPDGIKRMAAAIKGSFALAILTKGGVYAARDKRGYRPLILGKKNGAHVVSSESCSFNNIGAEIIRDLKPGEILFLTDSKYETVGQIESDMTQFCTFEWVYIANLASIIEGTGVAEARKNIGMHLARRYPVDIDVVAAVPNSGIGHALGYAMESKIPYDHVFVRYDYAGRSYTMPTQQERDREAKIKLISIEPSIKGKRVLLCDDSIVRGTQMKNDLVVKLRKAGAREIHARIACPPLKAPCRYGVSTRDAKELIANDRTIDEIRKYIGLDSLAYNTIEDMAESIKLPQEKLCLSCWNGKYR